MNEFQPYITEHLQVGEIRDKVLSGGRYYLVIWQGELPLGHYWLESEGDNIALAAYEKEILELVGPVMEYYQLNPPLRGGEGGLSVVICTRNRPEDLERSIRALLNSDDRDFELIIVDNASEDDRTERVVAGFAGVKYVREDRPGLDIARNAGARAAGRELIAYTDDDVEVSRQWTKELKAAFSDPIVMAITGMVIPRRLDTLSQYTFERSWSFNKGYLPKLFDHRWFLGHGQYAAPVWEIGAGANMAFRRDIFRLAGGFDERLDVGAAGCSGDSEMWYRVLAEGWNCLYLPYVVVYHLHRSTMPGLKKQLFYYMRGHVAALEVQYERYGHKGNKVRLYRGLPLYYLKRLKRADGMLWEEIKGCFSGWLYYRSVRKKEAELIPLAGKADERLMRPAVVNDQTVVSVVIAAYNHAKYLGLAIESVLEQTFQRVEIIVVDDGSTDGTEVLCRRYEKVRYIRVERVGPCAARNIGVAFSKGDYLVFLDADDLLYVNALELNLFYFNYYPDAAFVSGGHDRIDEAGGYLESPVPVEKAGDNYPALLQGNYIAMEATVMYRRELFFDYYFDPAVAACEDYDLNLRIARDWPVYAHAHKIAAYRIHGKNRSANRRAMAREAIRVLKRQEAGLKNEAEREEYKKGIKNWTVYYK
ncbi:MAG TPA: glycosyltransferase [Puia sp.]|jgi:glycosyltransferase involved in cell wall biosynthesis